MGLFSLNRRRKKLAQIGPDTAVDMEYVRALFTPNQRARGSRIARPLHRFEMWVLPLHHFVGLSKMRPHQELLKEGKLARYDTSMRAVFFFSHRKLYLS